MESSEGLYSKESIMKIRILDSANQDLIDGYRFYEKQAEEKGSFCGLLPY